MSDRISYVNALDYLRLSRLADDDRVAMIFYDDVMRSRGNPEIGDDPQVRIDWYGNEVSRNERDAHDIINDIMNDLTPLIAIADATHDCAALECDDYGYVIGDSARHDWYGVACQVVTVRDMRRALETLARAASTD